MMFTKRVGVAAWGVATLGGWGAAGAAWEARPLAEVEGLAPLVERWHTMADEIGLTGYAIALVRDGELLAAEGFGVRDGEGSGAVDPETVFYIASCTKTYVAAAIVKLADDGKLELDAPVTRYLPEFRLKEEGAAGAITVRDLLGHRPGLNSSNAVLLDAYTGHVTDERYFRWLSEETPAGEIDYTNVHYTLLGRVIERVTGMSWRDYLDAEVFTPAGMDRTTGYATELYTDANAAFPQEWLPGGSQGRASLVKNDEVMHAAGGLGTSAMDGARWVALQLGGGVVEGRRVFSERASEEMLAFQSEYGRTDGQVRAIDGFAAGWQRGTWRRGERRYYQHGGGYTGTAAHLSFMPEGGLGVVVLANLSPEGNGFADMVSIGFYDHELGVEGADDLIPHYTSMLVERRARVTGERASRARLTADRLSRPVRAYLGTYTNADLGEIEVWFEGGEMRARMGNLPLVVFAEEGGAVDRAGFEVRGEAVGVRFEVDASGRVTGLVGELASGDTEHRFVRR